MVHSRLLGGTVATHFPSLVIIRITVWKEVSSKSDMPINKCVTVFIRLAVAGND